MESNNDIKDQSRRRRRNTYPDGIAIEPRDILEELNGGEESSTSLETETRQPQQCEADASATADLFVTMCFFARLGFTQPPACLKCAYKSSGCGSNAKKKETITAMTTSNLKCYELVPWRIDANIPLHPDKLEGNVVFVTCNTARSLVNGDAYPSVRWDSKKKRLIISDRRQTL
eukprot:scaffold43547_cov82-Cyclotella_meneghiniana.AAC.2